MCGNFPNIKVVEGNAFALLLPLKRRTYESCKPIDEDIDATQLSDVVVKVGGVQYTPSLGEDGVTILLPATLERGTYDIILTATYQGSSIRAAYEAALSIVPWNSQSDAQQFVQGSPIVCDAAYIIGGALTDAELEALKEEYREKNAELALAIQAAEEAKADWERQAEQLTGVAQQGDNPEATNTAILTAVQQGGGGGSAAVPQISIADTGSAASQELAANTLYIFPNRTSNLTLTLGTPTQGEASEYHFIIEVGSTLPTITMPTGLTWKSGDTIAFDTDTTYEVSILDNYAIFVVW